MAKKAVKAVWDRRNLAAKRGHGYVEISIYLSTNQRKYYAFGKATEMEWRRMENSRALKDQIAKYEAIIDAMSVLGEDMTIENFENHLELKEVITNQRKSEGKVFNGQDQTESFLDFVRTFIENEGCAKGTLKHKRCVLRSLEEFGKIQTFEDLTPSNIMAYDRWLHNGERTDVTISQYHKYTHYYINVLLMEERIASDPYKKVRIKKGESKARHPLTEEELVKVREAKIERSKLSRVRDLFIFMAYTGLSYADTQAFVFKKMAVWDVEHKMYFIDGKRIKTGADFYTPILAPAMEVLERNDFQLLKISNQKANDHLHTIEEKLNISHPMTCHIARHSFATLCITHGVSMEATSKMLGHTNLKTTMRYAKILQSTVRGQAGKLACSLS